jgi:predicted DNA-binding WGR domain protein
MPRYELGGEFFWTIEIEGASITTSLGKIGNAGHARVKAHGSEAAAKRAYDEAIAEKLAQGYALATAPARKPAKSRAGASTGTKRRSAR